VAKKNNNIAIGSFIVGALVLTFLLLIFFSGGNYFTDKERVVMYFDGSVQGLQVGAPIKLKGVELGEIANIEVVFLADDHTIVNVVTADLILKRIHRNGEQPDEDVFDVVIEKGLRAQLNYQSLLTGLLYVELDFYPNSELRLLNLQSEYREFPTTKTDFESLFNQIEGVDLISISKGLASVLDALDSILKSGKLEQAASDFSAAAQAIEKTATSFDNAAVTLESELATLSKKLTVGIDGFTVLMDETNDQLPDLSSRLILTLTDLRKALNSIDETMAAAEGTFSEDSQLVEQLTRAAEEVDRAARAFRLLSETLEQEPEALIRGKKGNE